jgi:putative transposase
MTDRSRAVLGDGSRKARIACVLKLKPRPAQERQMVRWLWCLTGAYNWALSTIEQDAKHGVYRSQWSVERLVNGHGAKIGVPQKVLNGTVRTAYVAWRRTFKKLAQRPRRKGRRNRLNSFLIVDCLRQPGLDRIYLTGLGVVKFHRQDIPEGRVSQMRVIRKPSGWYLCLAIHAEPRPIIAGDGMVGIDPGFSSLLTLSTGEKVAHPRELAIGAQRVAQAQRGNRRRLTARLLERQASRRQNRNHHLSRRLVSENRIIVWSKDRSSAIARVFGKSVTSAGHQQLRRQLAHKSRSGGARFLEVDSRNSTRTCSACGALTGPTGWAGLKVRQWACACGALHDRDVNAALNTLNAGLGTSHKSSREAASGIAS